MKTTEKIVKGVKKSNKKSAEHMNETILCFETHFFEKDGAKKAKEGLNLLLELVENILKNLRDSIDVEDFERTKEVIINALKRIDDGTFAKKVVIENYSFKSDNVFLEILEKCLAA